MVGERPKFEPAAETPRTITRSAAGAADRSVKGRAMRGDRHDQPRVLASGIKVTFRLKQENGHCGRARRPNARTDPRLFQVSL